MPEKEITQVTICRRDYKIASDEWQPLYIQRLGEILNNEIQSIERETGIVDSYNLLILASLRIIDQLLQIEEKKTGSNILIREEIKNLNSRVESIL
jgi:cell division protein ZapA (FtsZ GTPase activity inhibitor)